MTLSIPHAEALYYLASHQYRIAGNGDKTRMGMWKKDAATRLQECLNAEHAVSRRAERVIQIEARSP